MRGLPRAALLLLLLLSAAPALAAATSANEARDELRELRDRISSMQKKLASAEESRSEASDALRESERAISEANRELRELSRQSRESGAKLGGLRKTAQDTEVKMRGQQEALGRMLRRQYLQGEPDAMRLLLARENPNDMARQMQYLGYVARARARLVEGLRANLEELERITRDIAEEAAAIARIAAEQEAQKKRLEKEKRTRADVLSRVSRDVRAQQLFGFEQLPFDESGRFVMPEHLRDLGKVDGGLYFQGAGEFFFIWNPAELARMGIEWKGAQASCAKLVAAAKKGGAE